MTDHWIATPALSSAVSTGIEAWRIDAPTEPLEHVIDRHGYVWRIVWGGAMATRSDAYGVISMGVVALEREVGPLTSLAADHGRIGEADDA